MKRAYIALLFVLLFAQAAVAVSVTETGISVLLSVGDEKRPIEASIVFTDSTGTILTPSAGVLIIPENETVGVQVFPKNASGPNDFIVGYTTDTIMPKEPKRAYFTDKTGWCFQLSPEETSQSPRFVRALQLRITDRDAKKSWIRVIFKITYGTGWVTQYDQLVLKTVPRAQLDAAKNAGSGGANTKEAIDAIRIDLQKMKDYVNTLEPRVTNLENWGKSVASGGNTSTAPIPTAPKVATLPVYFTGNFVSLGLRVTHPDGSTYGQVVTTTGISLELPLGTNIFDLLVNYGNGVLKQKRYSVPIDASSPSVTVPLGIGGR